MRDSHRTSESNQTINMKNYTITIYSRLQPTSDAHESNGRQYRHDAAMCNLIRLTRHMNPTDGMVGWTWRLNASQLKQFEAAYHEAFDRPLPWTLVREEVAA